MTVPKAFISYSHDDQAHKDWVLMLSNRLVKNGVDVILDQWDMELGSDLPHFMATGLTAADRVLVICTPNYVKKANAAEGGVGFEQMILTAQLMKNILTTRIIPVIRGNGHLGVVPTFLGSKLYIDFRDDENFEVRYAEVLRNIHGQKISPRPALGENPFESLPPPSIDPRLSFSPERYSAPALTGEVVFDYSDNDGCFVLGVGDMAFETKWSSGGRTAIHAYNDPQSIRTIALATQVRQIEDVADATSYNTSSRSRTPKLGEIVIWQNSSGYYLATKIMRLLARSDGDQQDQVVFRYAIAPSKSTSFALKS